MALRERLIGAALVLLGIGVLFFLQFLTNMSPIPLAPPETPTGFRPAAPFAPLTCLFPFLALGALGLILVGLREIFFPDSEMAARDMRERERRLRERGRPERGPDLIP